MYHEIIENYYIRKMGISKNIVQQIRLDILIIFSLKYHIKNYEILHYVMEKLFTQKSKKEKSKIKVVFFCVILKPPVARDGIAWMIF